MSLLRVADYRWPTRFVLLVLWSLLSLLVGSIVASNASAAASDSSWSVSVGSVINDLPFLEVDHRDASVARVSSGGKQAHSPRLLLSARTYDALLSFVAPRVTGTVWDDVVETGARYPGTEVPRSFRLGLDDGTEVWVHPNATEHLAERVLNAGGDRPGDDTESDSKSPDGGV